MACTTVPGSRPCRVRAWWSFICGWRVGVEMTVPGCSGTVSVRGPRLLMMYQPPGVAVTERVAPRVRDTGVSLYCRPKFLAELARQNGIERWPILEEIQNQGPTAVWLRQAD